MSEPTNSDLQESIRKQEETIKEHTNEDALQFFGLHDSIDAVHHLVEDVKGIATATRDFAAITNGKVTKHDKSLTIQATTLGIIVPILLVAGGYFFWAIQNEPENRMEAIKTQLPAVVQQAVRSELQFYQIIPNSSRP